MADNVTVGNATGQGQDYTVATDDDATSQHQYVKLEYGPDGTFTKVAAGANALPVQQNKASLGTQTSVASSASNVTLLAANASRQGATFYNDSTQSCFVRLAATATSSNFTLKMEPSSYFELPFGYTGIVDGIWASANGNMRVTEITV